MIGMPQSGEGSCGQYATVCVRLRLQHSMRTACDVSSEQILHFQGSLLQRQQNMLCAVHAELKLCFPNEPILASATFEEFKVLVLEVSVTSSISNVKCSTKVVNAIDLPVARRR